MIETLKNYRYGITTEVKYRGEWQHVHEVWFYEQKIGLVESGHIVDYSEIEDIRN